MKYLFIMLFLHLVDDYYLQGWLASAKQKKWWDKNAPNELYKNDYKCALIEHAFSWTFVVMSPWIVLDRFGLSYMLVFAFNWIVHSITDDLKANKMKINLCQDQFIHVIQVVVTWYIMIS